MPVYECWERDYDAFEDRRGIDAWDAATAAAEYMEWRDRFQGEWREEADIWVIERGQAEADARLFAVHVRMDPTYLASPAHEHRCGTCNKTEVCTCGRPDDECRACRGKRRVAEREAL